MKYQVAVEQRAVESKAERVPLHQTAKCQTATNFPYHFLLLRSAGSGRADHSGGSLRFHTGSTLAPLHEEPSAKVQGHPWGAASLFPHLRIASPAPDALDGSALRVGFEHFLLPSTRGHHQDHCGTKVCLPSKLSRATLCKEKESIRES